MTIKNMQVKDLTEIDTQFAFFHYTNSKNIESIDELGLMPKIGNSATGVELTEKIFFAIGIKGVVSIFDSWIRWLIAQRIIDLPGEKADLPFYRFCTFIMRMPFIRHIVKLFVNPVVWLEFHSKTFKKKSFRMMKNILEESCFLVLDLKEEVDFSYKDIDEVKSQKFDRKLLKTLYAKQNKMDSKKMDYWNMHTFSNVTVPPQKLTLVKWNNSTKCLDILLEMLKISNLDLKVFAPFLNEFLNEYHLLEK